MKDSEYSRTPEISFMMFRFIPVVKSLKMCVWSLLPEHHEVLDHLFAQVVVYAVDLVFREQGGQMGRQLL